MFAQITQLFDQPDDTTSNHGQAEPPSTILPSIRDRPNSSARAVHPKSAWNPTRTEVTESSNSTDKHRRESESAPVVQVYTPATVLEKYRKYLTPFEIEEIKRYAQIYYFAPSAQKIQGSEDKPYNSGFDDDKGRYKCVRHDHLGYRYEVLRGLGKGSFGDVVKTYDHKTKKNVAVKIIRNEKRFHKQAQTELKLLETLKAQDKSDAHNLIHMLDNFVFRNHLCVVFELLQGDLYAALKKTDFKGFKLSQIRELTKGVLQCLRVLRRNHIIHCDIKPENVLLRDKTTNGVKVIDFGSSCYDSEKVHTYIQSRFYRAPEVILNCGYGTAIDMWSLGCMVAEFHSGQPLFPGHDEKEQLMYQMEILGIPPDDLLARCKRAPVFFDGVYNPRFITDHKGRMHAPGSKTLAAAIGGTADATMLSFLDGCLQWDADDRMTPSEALKHPFITGALESFEKSLSGSLPPISTQPSKLTSIKRASLVSLSASTSLNVSADHRRYNSQQSTPQKAVQDDA
jgi:dual specificity tyrosine-phosphorylation-regulated kinase 2/3/4